MTIQFNAPGSARKMEKIKNMLPGVWSCATGLHSKTRSCNKSNFDAVLFPAMEKRLKALGCTRIRLK